MKRHCAWHDARFPLGMMLAAACGSGTPVFAPVFDLPATNQAAYPNIDELALTIAQADTNQVVSSASFQRGQTIELTDVPFGTGLVLHASGRVSGAEVAYGKTCAFDFTPSSSADQPTGEAVATHLYFAKTVTFATNAARQSKRRGATALATETDLFIISGDNDSGGELSDVLQFSPLSGQFSVAAGIAARSEAKAARLGDGRMLVVGGRDSGTAALAGFAEAITAAGDVTRVDEPLFAIAGHQLASLPDGGVAIFGGMTSTGLRDGVLVVTPDGTGLALRALRAKLATPRTEHSATAIFSGQASAVLIAGGRQADGSVIGVAELYRTSRESFAALDVVRHTLVAPRKLHTAVRLLDDSVLFIGGIDNAGLPVRTIEQFSIDGGFVAVGELPTTAGVIGVSATLLADGRVLIAGGRLAESGSDVDTAFIARADNSDGTLSVVATDRLSIGRAHHTATLLCDGTVMLIGGTQAMSVAERYNPAAAGRR